MQKMQNSRFNWVLL